MEFSPDLSLEPRENEGETEEDMFLMELVYDVDRVNGETAKIETEVEVDDGRRSETKRERKGKSEGKFNFPSFLSRSERKRRDKPVRFPSFASRNREIHDGESENSSTRRTSIWSVASGRSRKSSVSSISKWSLIRRKSSVPVITPAEMGVVTEDTVKEELEELETPLDSNQGLDLFCEDIAAPPPSLVSEELEPPRGSMCPEGAFRDERWLFPIDKERRRQSLLGQCMDEVMGGQAEQAMGDSSGVEAGQIENVRTAIKA